MLVLTRKLQESIYIGQDIIITVVKIDHRQVRIGVEAPQEVAVVRSELVADQKALTSPRQKPPMK